MTDALAIQFKPVPFFDRDALSLPGPKGSLAPAWVMPYTGGTTMSFGARSAAGYDGVLEPRCCTMASPKPSGMSGEDYLAWEAEQPAKHEFMAGEIFAMVGASDRHVTISGNLFAALRERLRGGPCRVYIADMKLRVEAVDAWFYPDVMVTCDPADHARELDKAAPVLVVEVLSPGTEAFDRGAKFAAYRTLDSLKEYLLVDPDSGRIELYRRNSDGQWVLHTPAAEEALQLASINAELTRAIIFEDADPG